jgi:hypothetical protein
MNNILLYLIYDLLKIYYLVLMIMGIEEHVIRVMGGMAKTYCNLLLYCCIYRLYYIIDVYVLILRERYEYFINLIYR